MEKRPCLFLALPHVPLDGVDDAQESKTYRPEMILAVFDLAKRRAPVHNVIVIAANRKAQPSRNDILQVTVDR
jgi:hypothetical protein